MSDKPVDVVLNTRINQQALNQALAGMKALESELQKLSRVSDDAIASQRKISINLSGAVQTFRNFAGRVKEAAGSLADFAGQAAKAAAKVGAGVFGLATASAVAYGQKFQGVEPDANRMVAAQKALSDAFTDFGRVMSRIVTPIMETFADIASAVTQALDKLIPQGEGNPLDKFIKDVIPNAIQTFALLTDLVKIAGKQLEGTFDEIATAIRKFINTGKDTFDSFGDVVKIRAEEIFDRLATAVRKFALDIEDFFTTLGNALAETGIGKALGLSSTFYKKGASPADRKAQEDADFSGRQAEREGRLAQFYTTSDAQNKIEDDLLKDRQKTRDKELADLASDAAEHLHLADDIKKALAQARENREKMNVVTKEFVDAYINFRKQTKDADDRLKAGLPQAQKSKDDADAKAQEDYNERSAELDAAYMADQLKALKAFRKQEEKEQRDAGKERLRILRDLEDRLTQAAANRDVAGFIEAQKAGKRQLDDQAEQADQAAKDRLEAFNDQQEESRENYQKQRSDLRDNLEKQQAQNKRAYEDQLRDLRQKHEQEKQQALAAYAEQLAMLNGANSQLNAAYAAHYATMTAEAEAFVARNQAALNKLYQGATGGSTGRSATDDAVAALNKAQQSTSYQQAQAKNAADISRVFGGLRKFHNGGYVEKDMVASLRKGERVYTPEQQAGMAPTIVNFNGPLQFGKVATPDDVSEAESRIYRTVRAASERVANGD